MTGALRDTIDAGAVARAARRIDGRVLRTPVVASSTLSDRVGGDVRLKLETLQATGSFKVRGAWNHLLAARESAEGPPAPPIAFSTGNHGRAVALAARELGMRAIVCAGGDTDSAKLDSLRRAGADVVVVGAGQDDAAAEAERLASEHGLDLVAPFDDPDVIAGQGTIGAELAQQLPELDTVVVPVSGGGLIGGVALALSAARPEVRVVGVCAQRTPGMAASVRAGHPVPAPDEPTLADSLRGGVGAANRHTVELCRAHVDEIVCVSEAQIADAMAGALRDEGLVLEGAAAVGLAAVGEGLVHARGLTVAVVVTGRNVPLARVIEIERERPAEAGR